MQLSCWLRNLKTTCPLFVIAAVHDYRRTDVQTRQSDGRRVACKMRLPGKAKVWTGGTRLINQVGLRPSMPEVPLLHILYGDANKKTIVGLR
jgi:hypothetical protein